MKIVVPVVIGVLMISAAQGAPNTPQGTRKTNSSTHSPATKTSWKNICTMISKYAIEMEKAHQSGVPLSTTISNIKRTAKTDATRKLVQPIIFGAYKKPRATSPAAQEKIIGNYRNEVFEACAKTFGPGNN